MQIVLEVVCFVNGVVCSLVTGIAKKLPSWRTRIVSINWLKWIQENKIENAPILGAFPKKGLSLTPNLGYFLLQEMLDLFCRHWHLFVLWGLFDRSIGRAKHAIVVDDSSKKTKERLLGITAIGHIYYVVRTKNKYTCNFVRVVLGQNMVVFFTEV